MASIIPKPSTMASRICFETLTHQSIRKLHVASKIKVVMSKFPGSYYLINVMASKSAQLVSRGLCDCLGQWAQPFLSTHSILQFITIRLGITQCTSKSRATTYNYFTRFSHSLHYRHSRINCAQAAVHFLALKKKINKHLWQF